MAFTTPRTRDDIKIHRHTGLYDGGKIRVEALEDSDGTPLSAESFPHDLLDAAVHSDTVTNACTRGSLIYGNTASPAKWSELGIGAASTLLKSDGTDPSWGTVDLLSAFHGDTLAAAVSRGSLIYGNATPKWAELTVGSANQVIRSDGTDLAWAGFASFTSAEFLDSAFRVIGSSDGTKKLAFEVDGLTTATTRTLTVADADGVLALLGLAQTWTAHQTFASRIRVAGPLEMDQDVGSGLGGQLLFVHDSHANNYDIQIAAPSTISTTVAYSLPDAVTANITLAGLNNKLDAFAATTSAELASVISDETGSGALVFGTSPTIVTPTIASFANATHTHQNAAGGGTLTAAAMAAGTWSTLQKFQDNAFQIVDESDATKLIQFSTGGAGTGDELTLVWAGTDDRSLTFPDATTTLAGIGATQEIDGPWTFDSGAATFGKSADDETLTTFKGSYDTTNSIIRVLDFLDSGSVGTGGGAATNFRVRLCLDEGTALASDITVRIPSGAGTLVTTTSVAAMSNKTLIPPGGIRCSASAAAGIKFQDGASTTQYMLLDLADLTGERDWKGSDEAGRIPLAGTAAVTAGNSATARVPGKYDVTGRGSDIAATTLVTTPTAGIWAIHYYIETTATDAGAGTLTLTYSYTDDIGATTQTDTRDLTASGRTDGTFIIYSTTANQSFTTTASGTYGTATYALRIRPEFLG